MENNKQGEEKMCNREECTCDVDSSNYGKWKQLKNWREQKRQEKISKQLDIANKELVRIFESRLAGIFDKKNYTVELSLVKKE